MLKFKESNFNLVGQKIRLHLVADQGFPREGQKSQREGISIPKNCMKLKKFWPGGGRRLHVFLRPLRSTIGTVDGQLFKISHLPGIPCQRKCFCTCHQEHQTNDEIHPEKIINKFLVVMHRSRGKPSDNRGL